MYVLENPSKFGAEVLVYFGLRRPVQVVSRGNVILCLRRTTRFGSGGIGMLWSKKANLVWERKHLYTLVQEGTPKSGAEVLVYFFSRRPASGGRYWYTLKKKRKKKASLGQERRYWFTLV